MKWDWKSTMIVSLLGLLAIAATFGRDITRTWSNQMGTVEVYDITVTSAAAVEFAVSTDSMTLATTMNRDYMNTIIIQNIDLKYAIQVATYSFTYGNGFNIYPSTHGATSRLTLNTNKKLYGRVQNASTHLPTVQVIQGGL